LHAAQVLLSRARFNFLRILASAVESGNPSMVQVVLSHRSQPLNQDPYIALRVAIKSKSVEIVRMLLADCEFTQFSLGRALLQAVQMPEGSGIITQLLLQAGASALHAVGASPILIAMSPSAVRLLVSAGADPRAHNDAALLNMVKCGDLETVRWLVEGIGADPHVDGDHALWLAASYGKEDIVRYLLDLGCSPNARRTGGGRGARNQSEAPQPTRPWLLGGSFGIPVWVRGLMPRLSAPNISRPTTANPTSANVLSPLAEAATRGHLSVVRDLIEAGAEVITDHAVLLAAMNGHIEIVDMLMAAGADDFMERTGRLVFAAGAGDTKTMRECLRLRDSILSTSRSSYTVNSSYSSRRSTASLPPQAIEVKINPADVHYMNDAALMAACRSGNAAAVGLLVRFGADVHARFNSALCIASEFGHDEVVSLLIRAGADVNSGSPPPLSVASVRGHTNTVKVLINSGATLDGVDLQSFIVNRTNKLNHLLCDVIEAGHVAVARLLLETKKFRIDIRSSLVAEDLLTAAFRGASLQMASLLLEFGADPEPHRMWTVYESAVSTDQQLAKRSEAEDPWHPTRGFLHELINNPFRNHSAVVRRLARCGAFEAARIWGVSHGIPREVVDGILHNARHSLTAILSSFEQEAESGEEIGNASVSADVCSDLTADGAVADPFGSDNLYDPSIWNNHTILEHAATWCGYSLIRALSQAGELLLHGGSAALARAVARDGTASIPIIVALIDAGVDPCEGIRSACAHGRVDLLRFMIRQGVSIGRLGMVQDPNKDAPEGDLQSQDDIAASNEPESPDEPSQRPNGEVIGAVAAAVRSDKLDVLRFLLEDCGLSPDGTPDVIPFLATAIRQSGGSGFDRRNLHPLHRTLPLRIAVRSNNVAAVRLLLEFGACVRNVRHLAILAVRTGNVALLELLLESGMSPDRDARAVRSARDGRQSSVGPALSLDESVVLDLAVERDSDVDIVRGCSQLESEIPLVVATRLRDQAMIRALINAGADVDAGDGAALSAAVRMQDDVVVRLLVGEGRASEYGRLRGRLMLHIEHSLLELRDILDRSLEFTAPAADRPDYWHAPAVGGGTHAHLWGLNPRDTGRSSYRSTERRRSISS
ncbi:hypothetical protein HK405_006504, partial [Cladochytrium tenue]